MEHYCFGGTRLTRWVEGGGCVGQVRSRIHTTERWCSGHEWLHLESRGGCPGNSPGNLILPFIFQIWKRVLKTKGMSFPWGTASQPANLLTANPGLFPPHGLRHSSSLTKHGSRASGKVFGSERSWAAHLSTGRTRQKQACTSSLQCMQEVEGKASILRSAWAPLCCSPLVISLVLLPRLSRMLDGPSHLFCIVSHNY